MNELAPFRTLTPFFRRPFYDMENLWRRFLGAAEEDLGTDWNPRVDIVERPEAYLVTAELPGLKAEQIDVKVTGDVLAIRGEKKQETKKDQDHWKMIERRYGAFERTFTFPSPVDADHVEADLEHGVLKVRVMKKEEGKAAKVKIKAH